MWSRRFVTLICAYGAVALCVVALTSIVQLKSDLSFFLPAGETEASQLIGNQLREGPSSGLLLLAISGGDAAQRRRTSDELTRRLTDTSAFRLVSNGSPRFDKTDLDALLDVRYILNPPLKPADLTADQLRRALSEALGLLRTSLGPAVKHVLPADPTLRTRRIAEEWASLAAGQMTGGPWESRDGARALLIAWPKGDAFDFESAERIQQMIQRSFDAAAAGAGLSLELGGPGVIASKARDQIKSEAQWLSIISGVLVALFVASMFRSVLSLFVMALPIAIGFLAGATAVQLAFGHIHGVTLAFGGVLIGISVDYPIHLLAQNGSQNQTRNPIERVWPTLRLGALTTIVALLPMFFSSFPGLSQLGVFAATGLLAAAATTRWLLPATIPSTLGVALLARHPTANVFARARRTLQIGAVAVTLAALAHIVASWDQIWDDDLRSLSPIPRAQLEFDRRARADLGAPDVRRLIVVTGNSAEEVLRKQEELAPKLSVLDGLDQRIDMAARYIPSMRTQAARNANLPDSQTLRANLSAATSGLPFRADQFSPFLESVERLRTSDPMSFDAFASGRLGWRVAPLLFERAGRWIGLVTLSDISDSRPVSDLIAGMNDPSIAFVDLKTESDRLMIRYREQALWWLAGGVVAALLILALGLRSTQGVLRVAGPVAMSVGLTVAILFVAAGPLTLINVMALLLVAGLALDYALFLNKKYDSDEDARRTVTAVVMGNITTIFVFVVLAFSQLPVLNSMGRTVALGAVLCILLVSLFRRRQIAK